MKIAFVCPHFYPHIGGIETVVFQLAKNLASGGHEVTVLTQQTQTESPKTEIMHSFTVVRFDSVGVGDLKISFALLNFLRKNASSFDIIHSHNYHSFPALSVALTKKTPIVFSPHYHGTGHSKFTQALHGPYMKLGKHILTHSEVVLCNTAAEVTLIKTDFPYLKNVSFTPLGIDVEEIQRTPKFHDMQPYILSVGRLENYKKVERVICALKFLDSRIHLRIVGDGTQKQHLQDIADKLDLSKRISFLGNVKTSELFKLLKNAKAYITMSTMESYGLSLLEAVAAETGIVASDIPAHKELIKKFDIHNVSLLKPNSSALTLATSIRTAISNPAQTQVSLPSWNLVTKQTLEQYHSALTL